MKKFLVLLAFVTSVLAVPASASASTIGFVFDTQFSNGTSPSGPGPWLGALFNDNPIGGLTAGFDVRLTIFTSGPGGAGLTGTEFITEVDFNIAQMTGLNADEFNGIIVNAGNGALGAVGTDPLSFGLNAFQADGDGRYDMTMNFSSNPPRATAGNVYVIDIQWTGGTLTAGSFNLLAVPGGDAGPFFAAAHVQGITGQFDTSTWIGGTRPPCINCATPFDEPPPPSVPEPATLVLLGTGLVLAAGRARAWRKR